MRKKLFLTLLTICTTSALSLHGVIVLDEVMSPDEQQQTGVANLSRDQKLALEAWLNQNFIPKEEEAQPLTQLSLSINIDSGQKIELSDDSLWEISPDDVPTAATWLTPIPIKLTPSNNPDYPMLLVNTNTGVAIKARKVSLDGS